MAGIKKLGCLGVLSRKTSKNPQKDESYQEGFRTDPYIYITHSPKLRIIFQIFHSLGPDAYFLSSDPGIERFETALSKEIKISKK